MLQYATYTSGFESGTAFIGVAVEHTLAPVGYVPAIFGTSDEVHAGPGLNQGRARQRPVLRMSHHETIAGLHR